MTPSFNKAEAALRVAKRNLDKSIPGFGKYIDVMVCLVDSDKPRLLDILKAAETDSDLQDTFVSLTDGVTPSQCRKLIDDGLIYTSYFDICLKLAADQLLIKCAA